MLSRAARDADSGERSGVLCSTADWCGAAQGLHGFHDTHTSPHGYAACGLDGGVPPRLCPQAEPCPHPAPILTPDLVLRGTRLTSAFAHVGTPILHSAITTIGAALVLCFCEIILMAKVGTIIAVNACLGIVATFVVLAAVMATFAPENFEFLKTNWNWAMRGAVAVIVLGVVIPILASLSG